MKISKWQNYTLCVCAIGGVMMVSSVKSVMAADNSNQVTATKQDKLAVTTQRILELHSKDGNVNDTQQSKVEWIKKHRMVRTGPLDLASLYLMVMILLQRECRIHCHTMKIPTFH